MLILGDVSFFRRRKQKNHSDMQDTVEVCSSVRAENDKDMGVRYK